MGTDCDEEADSTIRVDYGHSWDPRCSYGVCAPSVAKFSPRKQIVVSRLLEETARGGCGWV